MNEYESEMKKIFREASEHKVRWIFINFLSISNQFLLILQY